MTETLYYLLIELRVEQQLPDQTNLNLRFIKNPIEVSIIMFMLASHAKRKPLHNENNFPHRSTFVHFAGITHAARGDPRRRPGGGAARSGSEGRGKGRRAKQFGEQTGT